MTELKTWKEVNDYLYGSSADHPNTCICCGSNAQFVVHQTQIYLAVECLGCYAVFGDYEEWVEDTTWEDSPPPKFDTTVSRLINRQVKINGSST